MGVRRLSGSRSKRKPSTKVSAHEKRKRILDAAIKVFARKGYYGCRVSDIAKEADIAYGLVYHYFKSKEDVLNSIFQERWQVFVEVLKQIEAMDAPLGEKLRRVAGVILDAYRMNPEMIEVVIMEIARNSKFFDRANVDLFTVAMGVIERMITTARDAGRVKNTIEPRLAAYTFFSTVEALLTGSVVGAIPLDVPGEVDRIRDQVLEIFLQGIET